MRLNPRYWVHVANKRLPIIHPDAWYRIAWDCFVLILVLWNAILVPYQVSKNWGTQSLEAKCFQPHSIVVPAAARWARYATFLQFTKPLNKKCSSSGFTAHVRVSKCFLGRVPECAFLKSCSCSQKACPMFNLVQCALHFLAHASAFRAYT
eukprot:1153698-Pelagomonas_calceolata.AAC.6